MKLFLRRQTFGTNGYSQRTIHHIDGWYIYSNISNSTKVYDLKCISKHLKLGLKIEEGKPEK